MRRIWQFGVVTCGMLSFSVPAQACRTHRELEPSDVQYADAVVVGRISNYKIVRDMEFRRRMLEMPGLSDTDREFYSGAHGLLPDYAQFEIEVDEVLLGDARKTVEVAWDNSTFGEPDEMLTGTYLVALLNSREVSPDPTRMSVLQAACATAFILPINRKDARKVRFIVARRR